MDGLKGILGKILKSVPQYEQKMAQIEIYEAWREIVGERTAQHTWPVKLLDGGLLLIAADNSAWLQSLKFLEPQILDKYEKKLKSRRIKGLRFKMQSRNGNADGDGEIQLTKGGVAATRLNPSGRKPKEPR